MHKLALKLFSLSEEDKATLEQKLESMSTTSQVGDTADCVGCTITKEGDKVFSVKEGDEEAKVSLEDDKVAITPVEKTADTPANNTSSKEDEDEEDDKDLDEEQKLFASNLAKSATADVTDADPVVQAFIKLWKPTKKVLEKFKSTLSDLAQAAHSAQGNGGTNRMFCDNGDAITVNGADGIITDSTADADGKIEVEVAGVKSRIPMDKVVYKKEFTDVATTPEVKTFALEIDTKCMVDGNECVVTNATPDAEGNITVKCGDQELKVNPADCTVVAPTAVDANGKATAEKKEFADQSGADAPDATEAMTEVKVGDLVQFALMGKGLSGKVESITDGKATIAIAAETPSEVEKVVVDVDKLGKSEVKTFSDTDPGTVYSTLAHHLGGSQEKKLFSTIEKVEENPSEVKSTIGKLLGN